MSETNRCDGTSRRSPDYSAEETRSEPSGEELAAATETGRQQAEREAETRRNAYIQGGEDVGGRCRNASSDAKVVPNQNHDDPKLKDSLRTRKCDPPLQEDVPGNALVGALGGGLVGAARAVAARAAVGAATRSVLEEAAGPSAKGLAKIAVKEGVKEALRHLPDASAPSTAPATPAESSPSATSTSAGRSSPSGTSEPAPEPNQTPDPRAQSHVWLPLVIQG